MRTVLVGQSCAEAAVASNTIPRKAARIASL
jgi:hypothetical protein